MATSRDDIFRGALSLSESDRADLIAALIESLDSDVEEVWLVVPRTRTVMVYRSGNHLIEVHPGEMLETPLLPGWSLDVGGLIPEIPFDSSGPSV